MPDPRYPGAVWNPGVNAGYAAGRTSMESVVCHYTVGRDSTAIGLRGYFHWLVSRDGRVQQFAEADAVCWHAGSPWNGRGPGIEVEYLNEPEIFTPEADAATAALCDWLTREWGIPADFYDGTRTRAHHGYITHRSLIQTGDAHSDYWPYLPASSAPEPAPSPSGDSDMWALLAPSPDGIHSTYLCGVGSAIVHDLHGEAKAYGLPLDEIAFVGWNPGAVATQKVSPKTIETLRALWPNVGDHG